MVTTDQVPATWLDATPGSAAWCRCTAALRGGGAGFPGQTLAMASLARSQLSSVSDGIDDLARRVAELADELEGTTSSDAANALYEAERSLRMAIRAVERAGRNLAD
jgi:hypothetical protein